MSSDADPADPARPALNGRFGLRCTDAEAAWTIRDGDTPGTTTFDEGADAEVPAVTATASDLLLGLYGRVDLNIAPVPSDLVQRFRALCFTD